MDNIFDKINPTFRRLILITADITSTILSFSIAGILILSVEGTVQVLNENPWILPTLLLIRLSTFYSFDLLFFLWRYATIKELLTLIKSISISSLLFLTVLYAINPKAIPTSVILIDLILCFIFVGGSRLTLRVIRDITHEKQMKKPISAQKRAIIIGAGDAGAMIAREITKAPDISYKLIGFLDDKKSKKGQIIYQTPVFGPLSRLEEIATQHQVEEVIIAIPSAKSSIIRDVVTQCQDLNLSCKITPSLQHIINGKVSVSQLRQVQIQDILGRESVKTDLNSISHYVQEKCVLITGAGGSIGSELCRQIFNFKPTRILLLDNNEFAIYQINMELQNKKSPSRIEITPIVADVKNKDRLEKILQRYQPDVIFHAAAYKHVPLMEANVYESITNNVRGTRNILSLACKFNVERFVLISTDKAVDPANAMGASKRICEILMRYENEKCSTKFSAVRFGNVLGSNGSVVPLFKQQIANGGPITITDPNMTRYFMTIPEAVQLVIQAGALCTGGEIFVLDMGEPVKIINLAKEMIKLSGLEEGKDIEIKVIGKRPGEKIHEKLFFDIENLEPTSHKKIFISKPVELNLQEIYAKIDSLINTCDTMSNDKMHEEIIKISQKALVKVSNERT